MLIFNVHCKCNTSAKLLFPSHGVDADTEAINQPNFIVFYSMLLALFKMFCFVCKPPNPAVDMATNGTMVTVTQNCRSCGPMKKFKWMSQPLVFGRHPAGNLLLSFGAITSGVNISQMLLLFKHMGLCTISLRTYFVYQNKFLFPSIMKCWRESQAHIFHEIEDSENCETWSGDGRYDSMGHCAKYGTYTMFNNGTGKLVHFEILQVLILLIYKTSFSLQYIQMQSTSRCQFPCL